MNNDKRNRISQIKIDNSLDSNKQNMANAFNQYFSIIGSKLNKTIKMSNKNYSNYFQNK